MESTFIARINVPEEFGTPVRAYVFRNGFQEGYDRNVQTAFNYLSLFMGHSFKDN